NWRVLSATSRFCSSMFCRSSSRSAAGRLTGTSEATEPRPVRRRRQRKATAPSQSGSCGGGSSRTACATSGSSCPSSDSSRPASRERSVAAGASGAVVGIDRDIVMGKVTGPDGGGGVAPRKQDADQDLGLPHHPLAVFLAV